MTADLSGWQGRPPLAAAAVEGRSVRLEPIGDDRRFGELFEAFSADRAGAIWRWLAYGPFADRSAFEGFAEQTYLSRELLFHAVVPAASGRAEGVAALMRTDAPNGVTEVGHVCLAPSLQRTVAATEGFALLMRHVFEASGYRRFEWKCNSRNAASRRAAERLGFRFEGVFRQHMVVKGENRDTAWFSMLDGEWPRIRDGFAAYLDPSNFDAAGRQVRSLADLRDAAG